MFYMFTLPKFCCYRRQPVTFWHDRKLTMRSFTPQIDQHNQSPLDLPTCAHISRAQSPEYTRRHAVSPASRERPRHRSFGSADRQRYGSSEGQRYGSMERVRYQQSPSPVRQEYSTLTRGRAVSLLQDPTASMDHER